MKKLTKKQLEALQRIIDREDSAIKQRGLKIKAGLHQSQDNYFVTDGVAAIMFPEKPEGITETECMDSLYGIVGREIESDHFLAMTVTADCIKEWKELAKAFKKKNDPKPDKNVLVKLTAQANDGRAIEGFYNPCYILNIVDIIGPGAMLYIGISGKFSHFPTLLAYPKNWMEKSDYLIGYLLPIRV